MTTDADRMAQINRPTEPAPGAIALELLVTDHVAHRVVAVTASTIRVQRCNRWAPGEAIRDPFVDRGPYPVLWSPVDTSPTDAPVRTLRRRADGTYRTHRTGHPLRFVEAATAHVRTDYRM